MYLVALLKNLLQNTIVGFSRIFNLPEMSGRETSTVVFVLQLGAKSENMKGEAGTNIFTEQGSVSGFLSLRLFSYYWPIFI